jgi:hypothetical protein
VTPAKESAAAWHEVASHLVKEHQASPGELVHSAPTLRELHAEHDCGRIDAAGKAAKAQRERAAAQRWSDQFAAQLPWLPEMIGRYERQPEAEARFMRAVDKDIPKIVHFQDAAAGLAREDISAAELAAIYQRQADDISLYAAEFTALTQLRHELASRVVAMVSGRTTVPGRVLPIDP